MTRNEATLYKDEDSIAMIDNNIPMTSIISLLITQQINTSTSNKRKEPIYHLIASILTIIPVLVYEDTSVPSSIIIESLLSHQSKIDSRINKVDATIVQILKLLQSDNTSNLKQNQYRVKTRMNKSSSIST